MEKRKVVTRGLPPKQAEEARKQAIPGSLEDMLSGGERPPELVFLAVVRIYDDGLVADDSPGEGCRATMEASYHNGGMYMSAIEGLVTPEECYDAVGRMLRSACVEAEEFDGSLVLPKG